MIIVLAILLSVFLLTSRRAHAEAIPGKDPWVPVVENEDGTACYVYLETAYFMKRPDGNHAFFYIKTIQIIRKQKYEILARHDINLSRRTSRIKYYAAFNKKGELDERVRFAPEVKKVRPIPPRSVLYRVYQMVLEQFVIHKILPEDAVSGFENPDPQRWVQVSYSDETRCVELENAAFTVEADGPHAIFWFQQKPLKPMRSVAYTLCSFDVNLIDRTYRPLDFVVVNDRGETASDISLPDFDFDLGPLGPKDKMWPLYQVILGRYAAEKVIPSETVFVFREPDPERWFLAGIVAGIGCYVDSVNTVFYKAPDGDRAVFWAQFMPMGGEEVKTRQLLRFSMNLTKRTLQLTDHVLFDDNGAVQRGYSLSPDELKAEEGEYETTIALTYDYLLERSKSAEWLDMKPRTPIKPLFTEEPKKEKRKKTSEKSKPSRKK